MVFVGTGTVSFDTDPDFYLKSILYSLFSSADGDSPDTVESNVASPDSSTKEKREYPWKWQSTDSLG